MKCEKEKKKADEEALHNPEESDKFKDEGNELFKSGQYPQAIKK